MNLTCRKYFHILGSLIILLCNYLAYAQVPHRRFEYKYSFKPPYLAQRDGTVPFWTYGGNTIASSENVRIVPSLRSQKGAIWAKNPTNFEWWSIDLMFRITSRGRVGADGLAFWYTTQPGAFDGNVFGSSDKWVGLGVFFDSFDNDNKHNNPYIMAMVNDGTKEYDHQDDGSKQQLAGCLRDFRNKPFPTRARIEYFRNTLTLLFHNGMTNNENDFEVCFRVDNVHLPQYGYFGVSAATGGLADDHDVIHFLTTSLHTDQQQASKVNEEEQRKLSQEYQDYQRKLELQKEEYKKEHPDEVKEDTEDWFESDNQRELRQIFQGQSHMYEKIQELGRKLDEVIGRQERTLSLVSASATGQQHVAMPAGGAGVPPPPHGGYPAGEGIRRNEVEALFTNQNILVNTVRELKDLLTNVASKSDMILNNQQRQPTASVQAVGYDMQSLVSEMRDGMNHVKQSLSHVSQRVSSGPAQQGCPAPANCLSLKAFIVVVAVQCTAMAAYLFYRGSKESQAKKFY